MIQWIFIIAIFVIIAFLLFRVEHLGKRVKLILFIIIGVLIYFSVMGLFSAEKIDLTSPRGIVKAVYVYFGWLGRTASNLWNVAVETTGKVIDAVRINNTGS